MGDSAKKPPNFPPNFVTIHQLQERWRKQQEQKQKEKEEQEQKLKAEQISEENNTVQKRDLTTDPNPASRKPPLGRRDKGYKGRDTHRIGEFKDAKAVGSKDKAVIADGNGEKLQNEKRGKRRKNIKQKKKEISGAEEGKELGGVQHAPATRDGEIRAAKDANAAGVDDAPPKSTGGKKSGEIKGYKSEFKEKTKDEIIERRVLIVEIAGEFENLSFRGERKGMNGRVAKARVATGGRPNYGGHKKLSHQELPKEGISGLVWVRKGGNSKEDVGETPSSDSSVIGPK